MIYTAESLLDCFSGSPLSGQYQKIGEFYDNLYQNTPEAWKELASRGEQFTCYMASLIAARQPATYLDIGCGTGNLLAAVPALEKYGLDISRKALRKAAQRCRACCCLGIAEELPFSSNYFDAVSGIGVMTHMIDERAATKEIWRVLKPGGAFFVGNFLRASFYERALTKLSEFMRPRPRPVALAAWAVHKVRSFRKEAQGPGARRADSQPIEKLFSRSRFETLFRQAGFAASGVITKRKYPTAPLAGSDFRIYVLEKR